MAETPGAALVRRFFESMQARRWDDAAACLAEDIEVISTAGRERYTSREKFVGMNRAYPEGWTITVERTIEGPPGEVAVEVRVDQGGQTFYNASFCTVVDGEIARVREHWVTEGEDEPPAWRSDYAERY